MLPILPPPLRRPPDKLTKMRRKELDEPKPTERLSKRGVEMRCSKCKRIGHNKRSFKGEVKRHKVGVTTQQEGTPTQHATPTHQQAALRQKLPFKRKPTTVRWMPSTKESSMTDH
ncbi:hypothetical protein J1N35_028386 [Gossypium stocksii]|uniref:Uncharacterized protein n=1 Tax=Gossypium stocksii TaxID=47602 RepID=A0A9D3ZRX8_9ROSI|nr:hypothetical protein J1N35_028386 [Gossypium stocksii]